MTIDSDCQLQATAMCHRAVPSLKLVQTEANVVKGAAKPTANHGCGGITCMIQDTVIKKQRVTWLTFDGRASRLKTMQAETADVRPRCQGCHSCFEWAHMKQVVR